ncbi:MAG TPA: tetratricopeptide repeat protein, partial [Vicinamibacterales bacterium]|nr:tetratricopeptide repeat protein [Vicinamibacterales bacterium]
MDRLTPRGVRAIRPLVWLAVLLGAACSDPHEKARAFLASAESYAARGADAEAVIEYRNAVKQDPQLAEAHAGLGRAYLRQGKPVEAVRALVRAADLRPRDAALQIEAGTLLLAAGDAEAARARAVMALAAEPRNPEAHILLASALVGLGRLDDAEARVERAAAAAPREARLQIALGSVRLLQGRQRQAEEALRHAVELDPRSPRARIALANYYWARGEPGGAEQALRTAVELDPRDLGARRALAMLLWATGRRGEAEEAFRALADAAGPPGILALADFYTATGRPDAAVQRLEALERRREWRVEALVRTAAAWHAAGRRGDAEHTVDAALREQAEHAGARLLKAQLILERGGSPDEALEHARAAAAARPDLAGPLHVMGLAHARARRLREAETAFAAAVRLDPLAIPVWIELSRLRLALGDLSGA